MGPRDREPGRARWCIFRDFSACRRHHWLVMFYPVFLTTDGPVGPAGPASPVGPAGPASPAGQVMEGFRNQCETEAPQLKNTHTHRSTLASPHHPTGCSGLAGGSSLAGGSCWAGLASGSCTEGEPDSGVEEKVQEGARRRHHLAVSFVSFPRFRTSPVAPSAPAEPAGPASPVGPAWRSKEGVVRKANGG